MLSYDLNKTILKEIEDAHSEYLMIDLDMSVNNLYRVEIGGKFAYIQEYWRGKNLRGCAKEINKDIKITDIAYDSLGRDKINEGIRKLADWAKKNFDEKKIIINRIRLGDKYINKDNDIVLYDTTDIIRKRKYDIKKNEDFLISLLPNSIVLQQEDVICDLGLYDDYTMREPQRDHYTFETYREKADTLVNKLGIDYREYSNYRISQMERAYREVKLKYLKEQFISNRNKNLNLNNYFERSGDLDKFIVIISVRDEAKSQIHKFTAKKYLGIKCDIDYRNSYIAVIDKKNNFVYEKSGKKTIEYTYKLKDSEIKIKSSGFDDDNISSIVFNGQELSTNTRGLNIVLIDSESLDIVDIAYCDTHEDRELMVHSDRFRTI